MDSILVPIKLVPGHYAHAVAIIAIIVLVTSWISVALRLYVRKVLVNNVGIDDWTVIVSAILFSPFCILLAVLAFGISNKERLSSKQLMNTTNMLLALELFYIATIGVFKISLGYFFLRVLTEGWQRRVVHWTLIVFSTYTIGYFFFGVFQCGVPGGDRFWQRKLGHQCASVASGLSLGYIHAILSAGSDLLFLALPIPIVRRAKLAHKEKVLVGGILVVATVGCIASLIRIKWVPVVTDQSVNFFYNGIYLAIWSVLEPGLGIIASSLATLRPLFRQIVRSIRTSSTGTRSNRFFSNGSSKPTSQSLASKFNFFFSSTGKSSRPDSHMNSYLDPEKAFYQRADKTRNSLPPAAEWKPLQQTRQNKEGPPISVVNPMLAPQETHVEALVPQPRRSLREAPTTQTQKRPQDSRTRHSRVRSTSPHLPYNKPLSLLPQLSTWFAPQPSEDTSASSRSPPMPVIAKEANPNHSKNSPIERDELEQTTWDDSVPHESGKATKVKLGPALQVLVEPPRAIRRSQAATLRRQQNERRRMRMMLRDPLQREGLPLGIFGIGGTPAGSQRSQRDDSSSVFSTE